MKNERNTRKSMLAAKNRALRNSRKLTEALEKLAGMQSPCTSEELAFIRDTAEDITQRAHEFNAYHNVLFDNN